MLQLSNKKKMLLLVVPLPPLLWSSRGGDDAQTSLQELLVSDVSCFTIRVLAFSCRTTQIIYKTEKKALYLYFYLANDRVHIGVGVVPRLLLASFPNEHLPDTH